MIKALTPIILMIALACGSASAEPPVTPAQAADNTYKILAYQGDPFVGQKLWSGTGWKITPNYMITAGHVCDADGYGEVSFRIQNAQGQSYPAQVIQYELSPFGYDTPGFRDLCLMYVPSTPGYGLELANDLPEYGTEVFFVGATHGEYQDGRMPYSVGHYSGADLIVLHSAGGASGSAVIGPDGVIGVLVAGYPGSSGLVYMVPIADLFLFLGVPQ